MPRAADGKSNGITAIPELPDMLGLEGAIVSIDAMGTQKAIAAKIVEKGEGSVLALKGNLSSLHDGALLFFADPVLAAICAQASETDARHGRVEERLRRRPGTGWLVLRHRSGNACAGSRRSPGRVSTRGPEGRSRETELFITTLAPEPRAILDAVRSHRPSKTTRIGP